MTIYRIARAGLAAAMLALAGCAQGSEPAAGLPTVAKGAEVKDAKAFFPLTVGEKTLRVQLAVTLPEMQRGLMGRRDLGSDDGMVFVYPAPQRMSFWMKNTPTPLDIGFFTPDGTLGEVYPLYPYDTTTVSSAGSDYTLALEVNQGWFAKHGLKPGARLNLAQLAEALAARGFEPRRYGVVVE
jgi:uncharacterized membrane protein (UPF0127 family)